MKVILPTLRLSNQPRSPLRPPLKAIRGRRRGSPSGLALLRHLGAASLRPGQGAERLGGILPGQRGALAWLGVPASRSFPRGRRPLWSPTPREKIFQAARLARRTLEFAVCPERASWASWYNGRRPRRHPGGSPRVTPSPSCRSGLLSEVPATGPNGLRVDRC